VWPASCRFAAAQNGDLALVASATRALRPRNARLTRIAGRYTGCQNMNFYVKAFENISYRPTDRQTDRLDRNYKARRLAMLSS